MELKVQTAVTFDDTEIYQTYTYCPNVNGFLGFLRMIVHVHENSQFQAFSFLPRCPGMRLCSHMHEYNSSRGGQSKKRLPDFHMWQSRIEIEYYSVTCFERITKFDVR